MAIVTRRCYSNSLNRLNNLRIVRRIATELNALKKENIGGRTSMKQQLERLEVGAPTWQMEVGWVPEAG